MSEKAASNNRLLPVHNLVDCSESMTGEPIEIVQCGLKTLMFELTSDSPDPENPWAWVSIIAFTNEARELAPLTCVSDFCESTLRVSGSACLDTDLRLLIKKINTDVRETTAEQKDDYKPMVFIFTNDHPTDNWEEPTNKLKNKKLEPIICCASSREADYTDLRCISDHIVHLQDASMGTKDNFLHFCQHSLVSAPEWSALPQYKEIEIVL